MNRICKKFSRLFTVVLLLAALLLTACEPVATPPTTNAPISGNFGAPTDPVPSEPEQTTQPTQSETEATTEATTQATTEPVTQPTEEATEPTQPTVGQNRRFEVHFIDVGQADAALVLCDDQAMLIDGGNVGDSSKLYTYLKKHNVTHLDYVVGTHAHEDHIGGIAGALNYASVGVAYSPVTSYSTDAFRNFVKAVQKHGVSLTVPSVGTTFSLGSATCRVLAVNTSSDTNNSSIVLRVTYGNTSFLFTGDAEREVEQALINRGENLSSTVLKVGHHGSETSTSYLWLRQIMPQYAIISVGTGNSYGHPTEAALSRLRDAEVKTFRTDMQGDIICISNGSTVTVYPSRNANADVFGGIGGNSTQKPPQEDQDTQNPQEPDDSVTGDPQGTHYVLNTNTKKFHYPECSSAKKISDRNRQDFYGTREELLAMGYSPCGNCDP